MIGFIVPASAADIGYVQEPVSEIYTRAGPLPLQAAVDIAAEARNLSPPRAL